MGGLVSSACLRNFKSTYCRLTPVKWLNRFLNEIGVFSVLVKTSRTIVSSSAPRCVVCAGAGLHGAAAGVSTLATPSAGRGRRRLSRAVATARVTLPRSHGHVTAVLRRV